MSKLAKIKEAVKALRDIVNGAETSGPDRDSVSASAVEHYISELEAMVDEDDDEDDDE